MQKTKNVLIVGAGDAGLILAKNIKKHPGLKLIGFADDNPGPDVLGNLNSLENICNRNSVQEIIIAIPSSDGALIRKILVSVQNNRIPIKIIPREQQVIRTSEVRYGFSKDLTIDDLLGRRYDKFNLSGLKKHYSDKSILVTGGAGSIGSEIVRQLLQLNVRKVVVYDNSEYLMFSLDQQLKENDYPNNYRLILGNILNKNKLFRCIKEFKPEIIIHAAAYKHVYLMQDNPDEAVLNNIQGTMNVVDAAIKNEVGRFTFISTDKVVNPTSVMGATKRLCEWYVQDAYKNIENLKWDIVRFGNVINSNGSVLPLFERQIRELGVLTVTHKQVKRFFMSIKEASRLVIESTVARTTNSAHILNMGELVSIYEIARCLIRSKNLIPDKDVKIIFTGLRKGEKMTEELFTEEEKFQLSERDSGKVFVLNVLQTIENPLELISQLITCSHMGEITVVLETLKKVFPSLEL